MSNDRCKHGVLLPARCRDCETAPIDAEELARFRRDVLGIEEESSANFTGPTTGPARAQEPGGSGAKPR